MNYAIQPHAMGVVGTATAINVSVGGFAANATSCGLTYQLFNQDGQAIFSNGLTLAGEDYENWGADNFYLVEYVCAQLGLQLVEPSE
jgi:hypothetical protein